MLQLGLEEDDKILTYASLNYAATDDFTSVRLMLESFSNGSVYVDAWDSWSNLRNIMQCMTVRAWYFNNGCDLLDLAMNLSIKTVSVESSYQIPLIL